MNPTTTNTNNSGITPELRALYQKAIATPNAITHAEKNLILERPPPDEEERLCLAKVHLTLPQLQEKAIAHPEQLTPLEAKIIMHGADYDPAQNRAALDKFLQKQLSMSEDRGLELDAKGAVKTRAELCAYMNANERLMAWADERREAAAARRGAN